MRPLKNIVVIDLDGTLCNVDHRLHYVRSKKKNFTKFYAEVGNDTPNDWCLYMLSSLFHYRMIIVLVSARPKELTVETRNWLAKWNIPFHSLYLIRPSYTDSTPDVELKQAWLDKFVDKDRISFTVDDRQRVVDMWRKNGLTCLHCSDWKEFKENHDK